MDNKNNLNESEMERLIREKEEQAGMVYDDKASTAPVVAPAADQVTSLGKASTYMDQGTNSIPGGESGWKVVPIENMPSEGLFYPDGTTVEIKCASVAEIRHFSTIDDRDALAMDDKLNLIMEKCVRLKFNSINASYKDLKEEDRFYLLFAIRELTFINGENKLFVNLQCGQTCQGDGSFAEKLEMSKDNFSYYDIDEKIMRYYDPNTKSFVINSDKAGGTIKLYVPSLGVTSFIKNLIRGKMQKGEYYDKDFIKFATFLFDDWRTLTEAKYMSAQKESMTWNPYRLSLMISAIEKIRFGAKLELVRSCNKCGAEVAAPISFPRGIKSLFLPSDPLDDIFGE